MVQLRSWVVLVLHLQVEQVFLQRHYRLRRYPQVADEEVALHLEFVELSVEVLLFEEVEFHFLEPGPPALADFHEVFELGIQLGFAHLDELLDLLDLLVDSVLLVDEFFDLVGQLELGDAHCFAESHDLVLHDDAHALVDDDADTPVLLGLDELDHGVALGDAEEGPFEARR